MSPVEEKEWGKEPINWEDVKLVARTLKVDSQNISKSISEAEDIEREWLVYTHMGEILGAVVNLLKFLKFKELRKEMEEVIYDPFQTMISDFEEEHDIV